MGAPWWDPNAGPQLPRGGRKLFPADRVVAYYGTDTAPALGVLGHSSPEGIWPQLAAAAAAYSSTGRKVLPAYELIVTVADGVPGPSGLYRSRTNPSTIDSYLAAAKRHDALLILDVQPGRGDFASETRWLAPWLKDPNVALALDPEWRMSPGQIPGQVIGSVSAQEINQVSAWLSGIVEQYNLPQKLLLVHQFTVDEITDKAALISHPRLAMTINMDGFGSRAEKLAKYRIFRADTRFPMGMKLFYRQDVDMWAPAEVSALRPTPSVIEYQ